MKSFAPIIAFLFLLVGAADAQVRCARNIQCKAVAERVDADAVKIIARWCVKDGVDCDTQDVRSAVQSWRANEGSLDALDQARAACLFVPKVHCR